MAKRKSNPSPEETLRNHSESWKNVRWDTLEFDEEDAAEMPYIFSVKVPCYIPEEQVVQPRRRRLPGAFSRAERADEDEIAKRRIESAVRHFFARVVTQPTGQRTLPGVRLRPAGVPSVGIAVNLSNYIEVEVTMAFDYDVTGQTLRDIVFLLDALDANPGAICPFPPAPPEEENPRRPNPAPTNTDLVGRLKF